MDHQAIAQVLGNYGEFLGAIAVVVTLFYLAVQVRHSKEATEAHTQALEADRKIALANMYHARAAEAAAGMRMLADSQVAQISIKQENSGLDSLDAEERFRLAAYQLNNFNRVDAARYAYEQGLLPEFEPQTMFTGSFGRLLPYAPQHLASEICSTQCDTLRQNGCVPLYIAIKIVN